MPALPRIFATAAIFATGAALAACGTTDLVGNEVDAQKNRVEPVIKDPGKAVDDAAQNELKRRGVDGQANPVVPQP